MNTSQTFRRVIVVGNRRVHLRHAGSGARVVMIHGSPASSDYFSQLIMQLSDEFCCIAADTPGFGESQPLPTESISIAALARATAELIETLQIAPCLVLGSHSGAAIALELAALRPDLVSGVVLDGLPMFNAEEMALFENYFEAVQIDARGGHYARTWTRIRDMFIWFPWTQHDPARLNGMDLPPAATAHKWVSMLFQSAPNYAQIYQAAIGYGRRAAEAAATQTRPALYLAHERDMLAPHLDRLPTLKPVDRIERTSIAPGAWLGTVRRGLQELGSSNRVTRGALQAIHGISPQDQFIDLPSGQLRLRRYGNVDAPALLMLHDSPASGRSLHQLADALAAHACIWVPDLPGCGASTGLPNSMPTLSDYVQVLESLLTQLQMQRLAVYGRGWGATLALMLAARQSTGIDRIWLDELPIDALADKRICPKISIETDGSHWFRTWQMLRDSQIYWPWYLNAAENLLRLPGNFGADYLHDWVRQVMEQPETAHCLPRAAAQTHAHALLSQLTQTITFMARANHPLFKATITAQARLPQLRVLQYEEVQRAEALRHLLGEVRRS